MCQDPSVGNVLSDIVEIGRRIYQRGMVAANDGNISCRTGENEIWVTPTGVSKGFLSPDMLVRVDRTGKQCAGTHKATSELQMHLCVYRENPDARAVVHAHPPAATAFAVAGMALESNILPEAIINLGTVPLAPYATPGTMEVAEAIAPYCKAYKGILLANHGALTWGKNLYEAYFRMESLEHYAAIYMLTTYILKKPNELTSEQVKRLLDTQNAAYKG
jgi:L-fuculose-phosphate aldolase